MMVIWKFGVKSCLVIIGQWLFLTEALPRLITVTWEEIGSKGKLMVRDLWLHKDLGKFKGFLPVKIFQTMLQG